MLVTIRTILGIICLVLCVLDICFLIKIRRTMKMESLLKDSLTYKELMKSLKLFGAIAILAFVVIILSWF